MRSQLQPLFGKPDRTLGQTVRHSLVRQWLGGLGIWGAAVALVAGEITHVPMAIAPAAEAKACRGEFGADLAFLGRFYTAPPHTEESNHYLDLWAGQSLRALTAAAGLTNNRTLFVNSHGEAVERDATRRYAFRPHESLVPAGESGPWFSAADLARGLGAEAARQIHNIVVSGCNLEGAFDAAELRKHFTQVTNVVHCPAGQLGYQAMFHQALLIPSARVQPRYEIARKGRGEARQYFLSRQPVRNARPLAPYVAELFRPGDEKPFRIQTAGRELLEPSGPALALARKP